MLTAADKHIQPHVKRTWPSGSPQSSTIESVAADHCILPLHLSSPSPVPLSFAEMIAAAGVAARASRAVVSGRASKKEQESESESESVKIFRNPHCCH